MEYWNIDFKRYPLSFSLNGVDVVL